MGKNFFKKNRNPIKIRRLLEKKPLSLHEIYDKTGLVHSTVRRVLYDMRDCGQIEKGLMNNKWKLVA